MSAFLEYRRHASVKLRKYCKFAVPTTKTYRTRRDFVTYCLFINYYYFVSLCFYLLYLQSVLLIYLPLAVIRYLELW